MFAAHNTSFDYWIFGQMQYDIDKKASKREKQIVDYVQIIPWGLFDIITDGSFLTVKKKTTTLNSNVGYKELTGTFDFIGARKRAYNTSNSKYIAKLLGHRQNINSVKGGEKVKVYKKQGIRRQHSNRPNNHKKVNRKRTKKF